MTQIEYNPESLETYLKDNPNAKNKALYEYCHATTKAQKGYIRKKKSRLQNKKTQGKKVPGKKNDGEITSLTPASVEKLIIDKLNNKSTISDAHIRMALDHVIKLKVTSDEID
ncbi:hypothetical protein LCGC14_3075620, partial [marine sediment metagenome]